MEAILLTQTPARPEGMTMGNDAFGKMLVNAVSSMARASCAKQGCITLGTFIALLDSMKDQSLPVRIGTLYVGEADSYRGYYERLAFATSDKPKTVAELLAECRGYIGQTFEGYKGGEYEMSQDTMIHAAEYGDCGPMIVGIEVGDDGVLVHTKEEDLSIN